MKQPIHLYLHFPILNPKNAIHFRNYSEHNEVLLLHLLYNLVYFDFCISRHNTQFYYKYYIFYLLLDTESFDAYEYHHTEKNSISFQRSYYCSYIASLLTSSGYFLNKMLLGVLPNCFLLRVNAFLFLHNFDSTLLS